MPVDDTKCERGCGHPRPCKWGNGAAGAPLLNTETVYLLASIQVSLANLLALARTQVEIVTVAAAEKGRLKSGPGHVNVKYKITDPTKTVTLIGF